VTESPAPSRHPQRTLGDEPARQTSPLHRPFKVEEVEIASSLPPDVINRAMKVEAIYAIVGLVLAVFIVRPGSS